MPKVSVIIPIYNTAAYLRETLDSICNQTLKELEIILINDGSTDESQSIIEEYAERDTRIKWYVQPNQGLSVARNQGLLHATGKYIYFMDSDDILDIQALQHCYILCEKKGLDFVFFDAEPLVESSDSQNIPHYGRKGKIDEFIHPGIEMLEYELNNRLYLTSVCLCLVNRLFLEKCFTCFHPGIIHEDHTFAMRIYLNSQKVCYVPEAFFKRRIRSNSIMTNHFGMRNIEGYTTVCTQIRTLGEQHLEWKAIIDKYLSYTLNDVIWASHRMTFLEKVETVCRFRRLRLGKYVCFRNWAVFWLKKK
ncbi:glycosyltransferase [Bacteroides helcogenes]|uniref:Glycosyl transferase family 2 n=1 Tax=Bacteroides helcogenes (strain ATCC 35417 / DSM 20613 / JCM 6297 / CCUG 15421 / P 36-108) TaxID=693979 RepID=E6SQT4_BACT6|nr:glycosyltransferase [Bacteroides helcogenes]ADV44017.1 glycosyl transferase family 2 [Bacteroides helcogenes P 36-108]MDY5237841.1 glycosyltransferase [Bacteroides helcogenes]